VPKIFQFVIVALIVLIIAAFVRLGLYAFGRALGWMADKDED